MLRPERMSRVSVTGSRRVLDDVVEAVHDLKLLHVTEYEDDWEGFSPGDPMDDADELAQRLVTVRSLQSTLGVEDGDAGPRQYVDEDTLAEDVEAVRETVNELDDELEARREELRDVRERIGRMAPFVDLGIELDLLRGYDSLSVAVGEGDADAVAATLADADVAPVECFDEDGVVAVFAAVEESTLQDALVGAPFTALEVPDGEGDPETYLADLREREAELESSVSNAKEHLEEERHDVGDFLLAAEEHLAIQLQKQEAPLGFATTDNAFVAEGWLPTDRYDEFAETLEASVGDAIAVEELERADYDDEGHPETTEAVHDEGGDGGGAGAHAAADGADPMEDSTAAEESDAGDRAAADGGQPAGSQAASAHDGHAHDGAATDGHAHDGTATDGGLVTMGDEGPPVVQENPRGVKPFEALVQIIGRPTYSELDPTLVFFLTFPAFFGFMIGDLGYGLLYMGLGYYLMRSFEGDVVRSLGGVGLWAGGFTALFGVLYGEIFGLHVLGEVLWGTSESAGIIGGPLGMNGPPIHKGLQPHYIAFAKAWLLVSVIVGSLHLSLGRAFDFVNNLSHGLKEAVMESGSWIVLTLGVWWWVFTQSLTGPKPPFLYHVFAAEGMPDPVATEAGATIAAESVAIPLGFNGFAPVTLFTTPALPVLGSVALSLQVLVVVVGFAMVLAAEGPIALVESITQAFGHVISYTRLAAVLLAKAGMALVVNLLVFGAVLHHGEFHFIALSPEYGPGNEHTVFAGLLSGSGPVELALGAIAGILVLVLGHILVLVLGVTSAGLQAVRLEYVEFFGKFYEGGGSVFEPFGYEREYTTSE